MAEKLTNLLNYRLERRLKKLSREWFLVVLFLFLIGVLIFWFLNNLKSDYLTQEKCLLAEVNQEIFFNNIQKEKLNLLNQERQDFVSQAGKLDLLLTYSRESEEWSVFFKNLLRITPSGVFLNQLDFKESQGLNLDGFFSRDLDLFVSNLKQEPLWSQVEILSTQEHHFLIQAQRGEGE